jgi:arginine exporter protein ArgO
MQHQMQRYPSQGSVATMATMASLGYMAPGHGYIPKKQKPKKPYGLPFTTVMNRTHRGPGKKYLKYALACALVGILFFMGAALYLGHRNVSRMIVMRTEVLGAIMVMVGILCVGMMGHYIWKARVESNRWRAGIRFRPEGLHTAAAINEAYVPEMAEHGKLATGTYGPKALKEIPKPRLKKKKKKVRSRAGSQSSLAVTGQTYVPQNAPPPNVGFQGPPPPFPGESHHPGMAYHQGVPYYPQQPNYPAPPGPGDNFQPIPMEEFGAQPYGMQQRGVLPVHGIPMGTTSESEL